MRKLVMVFFVFLFVGFLVFSMYNTMAFAGGCGYKYCIKGKATPATVNGKPAINITGDKFVNGKLVASGVSETFANDTNVSTQKPENNDGPKNPTKDDNKDNDNFDNSEYKTAYDGMQAGNDIEICYNPKGAIKDANGNPLTGGDVGGVKTTPAGSASFGSGCAECVDSDYCQEYENVWGELYGYDLFEDGYVR